MSTYLVVAYAVPWKHADQGSRVSVHSSSRILSSVNPRGKQAAASSKRPLPALQKLNHCLVVIASRDPELYFYITLPMTEHYITVASI